MTIRQDFGQQYIVIAVQSTEWTWMMYPLRFIHELMKTLLFWLLIKTLVYFWLFEARIEEENIGLSRLHGLDKLLPYAFNLSDNEGNHKPMSGKLSLVLEGSKWYDVTIFMWTYPLLWRVTLWHGIHGSSSEYFTYDFSSDVTVSRVSKNCIFV